VNRLTPLVVPRLVLEGKSWIEDPLPLRAEPVRQLEPLGVQPEKPPYRPGGRRDLPLIAFVADPDGYRIELIDGGAFPTPQDPRD